MKLPQFAYECLTTLADAVSLLASRNGDAKALARGQSLIPMMAFRVANPSLVVDLRKLPLNEIKIGHDGVRLGATVRWRDILDDRRLRGARPLLVAAVEHVAHYQNRNRGTIGGSVAHADPASEMAAAYRRSLGTMVERALKAANDLTLRVAQHDSAI